MYSKQIIELRPVTLEHKQALNNGRAQLASLLDVSLPGLWPHFPEAFELDGEFAAPPSEWPAYFFIDPSARALVGNGGIIGPPDANGEVEIGYEIAPQFQNQGFATAAVLAMLEVAFARSEVAAVVAQTLAESNASNGVLKKIGMSFVGEFSNDEVGKVWRWRLARATRAGA